MRICIRVSKKEGGAASCSMSGKVWLADSSLADGKGADGEVDKKRKKAKIAKRTTPTVTVPSPQTASGRNGGEKDENYCTIERSSYKNSGALDDEEARSALHDAAQPRKNAEFCGWETDGGTIFVRNALESSSTFRRRVADRSSLSTPAEGYRSALQSRACSRVGRRRKDCYEFKHLPDTHAYLHDYCTQCSYSALSLPWEIADVIREAGKAIKREAHGAEEREGAFSRRRGARRGNRYLEELASRLGVGVRESLDKKQLRHRPQPTPPSFTKKNRVAADLLVSTREEKHSIQDQHPKQTISEEQSPRDTEPCSRAVSASQGTPHTAGMETAHRLPTVQTKTSKESSKKLSTTSVTKYLTVSSRPQRTVPLGLGEEETADDMISHDSSVEAVPTAIPEEPESTTENRSSGTTEVGADKSAKGAIIATVDKLANKGTEVRADISTKGTNKGQQPTLFDNSWRDHVINQKARALGLVSRDWSQAPLLKRMITDDQKNTSRPHTRADTNRQHTSKDTLRRVEVSGDSTTSRPRTSCDKTAAANTTEKLKIIYEPRGFRQNKRCPSKQISLRNEKGKCETKRPATRCTDCVQRDKKCRPNLLSRPGTKLGKRICASKRPVLETEESQYWNEIPNRPSQLHTRTGTPMQVDSYSIPSGRDSRLLQSVKLYSEAKLSTVRDTHHSQHHAMPKFPLAFELSGHHHRHNATAAETSPAYRLSTFSRSMRKRAANHKIT